MFQLHDIAKTYAGTTVLELGSLSVTPGKTLAVIGPSGCGKTTLVRLMIGLIRPDRGTVSFDGTTLTADNVLELRHRMGYVIQEGGLFPHLTARRNVTLMAQYLGWNAGDIDSRVAELAELVRLPMEMLERYPVKLSGGQRQRVALMRALMLDPDLLLLDEPLGALDPMIRFELQNELKAVFEALGKTVVLVTHDMSEAAFFGDTILLLRDGRVVQQGTAEELAERPSDPFVIRFMQAQRVGVSGTAGDAT
ncbi:MAG TPA: ATP-binding cassette domain-containing protein [Gammaproteobacteria bacterium]|nr:ATP-binding cassette domain-containing protein [Gammaproteobacteria bacterium]